MNAFSKISIILILGVSGPLAKAVIYIGPKQHFGKLENGFSKKVRAHMWAASAHRAALARYKSPEHRAKLMAVLIGGCDRQCGIIEARARESIERNIKFHRAAIAFNYKIAVEASKKDGTFYLTKPAVFNCHFYRDKYADLKSLSCGEATYHWINFGIPQGRQGSKWFWSARYLELNPDLQQVFKGPKEIANAIIHYTMYGKKQGRDGL